MISPRAIYSLRSFAISGSIFGYFGDAGAGEPDFEDLLLALPGILLCLFFPAIIGEIVSASAAMSIVFFNIIFSNMRIVLGVWTGVSLKYSLNQQKTWVFLIICMFSKKYFLILNDL